MLAQNNDVGDLLSNDLASLGIGGQSASNGLTLDPSTSNEATGANLLDLLGDIDMSAGSSMG